MFMSFKLLKLRCKIFIWTLTGKIEKLHSRLQLTLSQGNPENILIIFPTDEPSFRVAYYTFRDLGNKSAQKRDYKGELEFDYKGDKRIECLEHIVSKSTVPAIQIGATATFGI